MVDEEGTGGGGVGGATGDGDGVGAIQVLRDDLALAGVGVARYHPVGALKAHKRAIHKLCPQHF